MKKIIAGLVVVGIVGGGVAWAVTRTPERRLCVRMGELCGANGDFKDYEACVDGIEELGRVVGDKPVENAAECVDKADSCVEATGCIVGVGYKAVPKLLKEFVEGFENAQ